MERYTTMIRQNRRPSVCPRLFDSSFSIYFFMIIFIKSSKVATYKSVYINSCDDRVLGQVAGSSVSLHIKLVLNTPVNRYLIKSFNQYTETIYIVRYVLKYKTIVAC